MITIISFGEMVIGKVSQTKRRHYIATKFFHICNVPLFPLGSFIFTGAYVIPIGLDGLSVLIGYLRGGLSVATFLAVLVGLAKSGTGSPLHPERSRDGYESLITACFFAACFAATYYFPAIARASAGREAWINGHLAKTRARLGERPIVLPPEMAAAAGVGPPNDAPATDSTSSDSPP
jgi:hypothetical protein